MVARVIETLVLTGLGLAMLKWAEPITRNFGSSDLAERYLGGGGTYTMWKLIGIIFIVAAFFILTGMVKLGAPSL